MKIVIIGYGPGGASAALAARMFNSDAEVAIVTEETVEAHQKPGASLALEFPDTHELAIKDWSFASLAKKRIDVVSGTSVVDADARSKVLRIKDSEHTSSLTYDRLILATGGMPNVPTIPGIDLPGVYTIQTIADTTKIGRLLSDIQKVAIIGAGFSGLEVAERLIGLGKDTHMVVRSRLMRRQLEESMSTELKSRIPDSLVFHMNRSPTAVIGKDRVNGLELGDISLDVDAVLFMTGVRPRVDLAKTLGVEIGKLGGICVDERMESSIKDIFAVGDCVEMTDSYTKKPLLLPVGSTAARAGRQAGVAAAGGRKIYSDIAVRLQYDHIFGNDVVCIGHSSTTANNLGVKTAVQYIEDAAEFSKVALVIGPKGRLIGGQVIATRQGARLGYEILNRVESGAFLKDRPMLESRHERIKEFIETSFGPIR